MLRDGSAKNLPMPHYEQLSRLGATSALGFAIKQCVAV
jgi:hypothetical protein